MTLHHACLVIISNRWLARRPRLGEQFYWHVLSKQRSCPPIHGIFNNAGVGNPTVPRVHSLKIGKFRDPGGDAQYSRPLYRDPDLYFLFCACFFLNPSHLEFQPSGSNHHQPQSCPGPAVQAGGWPLLSRRRILRSSAWRGI